MNRMIQWLYRQVLIGKHKPTVVEYYPQAGYVYIAVAGQIIVLNQDQEFNGYVITTADQEERYKQWIVG